MNRWTLSHYLCPQHCIHDADVIYPDVKKNSQHTQWIGEYTICNKSQNSMKNELKIEQNLLYVYLEIVQAKHHMMNYLLQLNQ